MHKLIRAAVATAIIGGVAAIAPSPASAHTSVCVGTGQASTPLLGYPVLDPTLNSGGFTFNLNTAGTCVSVDGLSGLEASGTLTGYCGISSSQDASLNDGGHEHAFAYQSAGSLIVILPRASNVSVGVANAVPLPGPNGTNSCLNNNATTFQVTGAVLNH